MLYSDVACKGPDLLGHACSVAEVPTAGSMVVSTENLKLVARHIRHARVYN